jgi:DNA-binding response OmpR family regulator
MYSNILQQILESAAYKVSRADDGKKGLALISRTKPDLVIMDFEMPGINGIEVMRILKENHSTKNIPVIMLTGFNTEKTVKDAMNSGAADFIIKPVERAVLLEKISDQLD